MHVPIPRAVRLGIVGANAERGWALDAHLPAIRSVSGFEIAAVSARSHANADRAATAFGAARGYADSLQLVRDPAVDLVVVTVRVPEHRAIVLAALAAGKHVYCEWPLGRTLAEAEEMAAAVSEGQYAAIGAQALSAPAVRHAIKLVEQGAIGRVLVLRAYTTAAPWGAAVDANSYLQDKSSGGTLATIGMGHLLPAVDAVAGPYREIDARMSFLNRHVRIAGSGDRFERTAEDHIFALGLHESGCVSTLEAMGGTEHPALLEVVGDKGWLRVAARRPGTFQIMRLDLEAGVAVPPTPDPVAPHLSGPSANLAEVYARLAQDMRTGTRTLPGFGDATRITRVIEAIDAASITGRRQMLDRDPAARLANCAGAFQ